MKLLMIIPSLGSGGAERVISSLANDWVVKRKCELHMVIFTDTKDFYKINRDIKVYRLNYNSNSKNKIFCLINLILQLRKIIININPDVCLSFLRESNILIIIASLGLNKKIFISERDSPLTSIPQYYKILRKKLYPLATGIIAQTMDYKFFIDNEINASKSVVIPNPIREINTLDLNREKIIVNVGRLVPEKGQKYLLEAFALCKKRQGWKLVLVGDGVLRSILEKKVKDLDLSGQVFLVGKSNNVDDWLVKSSIFAFSSISEGFPNALAEAMSAGLPCVSFDCVTGPSDLIEHGTNGFLVETKNIQKFSEYLDLLMEKEELRESIGLQAKLMSKRLNFDVISDQYFKYISGTGS
ncbi:MULTISPECIES: glycosyltransferase [Acinetobacter]|uniref:glycosyltransferase n=1 Tax=Acinetobacter TaxID=469 RepID=UPI0015D385BF|nr:MULTISPECIES: glycosyltransferase [Acinetobacter]